MNGHFPKTTSTQLGCGRVAIPVWKFPDAAYPHSTFKHHRSSRFPSNLYSACCGFFLADNSIFSVSQTALKNLPASASSTLNSLLCFEHKTFAVRLAVEIVSSLPLSHGAPTTLTMPVGSIISRTARDRQCSFDIV